MSNLPPDSAPKRRGWFSRSQPQEASDPPEEWGGELGRIVAVVITVIMLIVSIIQAVSGGDEARRTPEPGSIEDVMTRFAPTPSGR